MPEKREASMSKLESAKNLSSPVKVNAVQYISVIGILISGAVFIYFWCMTNEQASAINPIKSHGEIES